MAQPQWATQERRTRLVQLALANKGRCLKGHALCQVLEHYVHTFIKVETRSGYKRSIKMLANDGVKRWVAYFPLEHPEVQHEELSDRYGVVEEAVIEDWKQEDREERAADGKVWDDVQHKMSQQLAPTGEVGSFVQFSTGKGWRRNIDPIEFEKHVANRPRYYLKGYGVDDKMRRFAKARIPGTNIVLHVDVSQSIQELSQRKRKWLRRNGIVPETATALIESAVSQWWAK